jgi:hypothetical protein
MSVFIWSRLTIKPSMLMMTMGASSRQFPLHQPIRSNLALWKQAVGSITVSGARLRIPLGAFVGIPHWLDVWFTNANGLYIYHMPITAPPMVYERPQAGRTTCFGSTYILSDAVLVPPEAMHRVSIWSWNGLSLCFHSSCPQWVPHAVHVPRTLLDNLPAWGNQSLWSTLRIDGDHCTWIFQGLMHGSLIIGHDGSYMPQVANDICACAAVFYCTHKDKYTDVTWVEKSSKLLADNYWAEILGGCCAQLIVKAAIAGRNVLGSPIPHFGCDNMGVVLYGNNSRCPLLEKQAQADVLQYIKQLISELRIGGTMVHVHGHMDEHLCCEQLTPAQLVNVKADELASSTLMLAITTQTFIKDIFPSEGISLKIGDKWITGSPKMEITHLWGEQVAQDLLHRWKIVHTNNFPLVYLEGMDKVMRSFPEMFRVWITKHVSHFNGTNRMLSRFLASKTWEKVKNRCPNCRCFDKSTQHITRCRDEGRTDIFTEFVTSLVQWLSAQHTHLEVVYLFRSYLLARGTHTMASLLRPESRLRLVAEYHDRFGWDNFLEGRICAIWVELRSQDILEHRLERNADHWAQGLMRCLLETVHKQWLYQNATVHMELKDEMTLEQHKTILTRIETCLGINPGDLLKDDRALLWVDFAQLATGPAKDKLEWVAGMDSATGAAKHVACGSCQAVRTQYCRGSQPCAQLEYEAVLVDSEGSMRWRGFQKRG